MIDRIDNNQPLAGASSMFPNAKKALADNDLDVSINGDYSTLIERVIESQQSDAEIVEQARESLRTGELESPQSFHDAALNMLTFGI